MPGGHLSKGRRLDKLVKRAEATQKHAEALRELNPERAKQLTKSAEYLMLRAKTKKSWTRGRRRPGATKDD